MNVKKSFSLYKQLKFKVMDKEQENLNNFLDKEHKREIKDAIKDHPLYKF